AIRQAKGYTKRRKIVKFEGCYHGHYDGLLVKSGSGAKTYHVPTSEGVSAEVGGETLVVPYNDVEALKTVFQEYGDEIAGVIVEPVAGNMGVIGAAKDFLQKMRHLTEKNGSLLIFDEVITGFRLGLGGAAEYYGIEPDLACFGKIIGGGMPVGADAGKKE
ncbi:MAG TPA: aspartate aminotransferase family protein, partial [Eubacteriaceae bacterium]|nr:aspartate aminotransferase family protein [Eubacteriaceae bacterium]